MAESTAVVADASVLINLNATARAADILAALPYPVQVTDIAAQELAEDRRSGRNDRSALEALVGQGHLHVAALSSAALSLFESLVVGAAVDTLDDGEAATLAHAADQGRVPALDDRKGLRLCGSRFPFLRPVATVDLFRVESVAVALGRAGLGDAVFLALRDARMRVMPHHVAWVIGLIGPDRASLCPSLPRQSRLPPG